MSYRLKLTKARSYTRGSVTVTQEKPFADVEDAKTAEALLASGYFTLVSSSDVPDAEQDNSGTKGTGADSSGTERTEPDSSGTERTEPDSSGTERTEPDSSGTERTEPDNGGALKGHFDRTELSKWEDGALRKLAADMSVEGAESLDRDALLDALCAEEAEAEPEPDYDALSKMSKADLTAYAKERDIDISKCKTKSDILTAISMAYGGSPTMIDLQREPDGQGGENE